MLKRYYTLFFMAFFLASGALHAAKNPPVSSQNSNRQIRPMESFSQVEAQGRINVTLHTGYSKPQVVLSGDPSDLAQVKAVVSYNTLYLVLGKGYPKQGVVHADIQGQYLTRFSYKGEGLVDGSQIRTSTLDLFLANQGLTRLGGSIGLHRLDIIGNSLIDISGINSRDLQINVIRGNPKLLLSGTANITNLGLQGNVWLSMYWLKSDRMVVRAKQHAKIQFAGIVNRLEVELWGHAHFKGRYLRAQRSFVRTHGHSIAEISSVNHQSTLSLDASDIYYYNLPATREDFMAYDGSVLDMREWSAFELRDFDRYNKQFP